MSALIAGYARTPFTRFNGQLAGVPAVKLGAHAAAAALRRAGLSPVDIQRVVAGTYCKEVPGRIQPGRAPSLQAFPLGSLP